MPERVNWRFLSRRVKLTPRMVTECQGMGQAASRHVPSSHLFAHERRPTQRFSHVFCHLGLEVFLVAVHVCTASPPAFTRRFAAAISNSVEGVATGGDDSAPPGSACVGSSTRGCFAELSSSVVRVHFPPLPCIVGIDRTLTNRHTSCHLAHNSSWWSNRKSCRTRPSGLNQLSKTVTRAERMPRAEFWKTALSGCPHEHELCCTSHAA